MPSLKDFREAAGLTQDQLADMADTSQPQIAKLERGERRMTLDWAVKLGRALNIDPTLLLPESAELAMRVREMRERTVAHGRPGDARVEYMPVRAAALGDADQGLVLEEGPIDWVPLPDYLKHARNPYGMYVVGESMMPRFRPAQLLHVNPHKPPAPGAGVVLVKKNQAVMLAEYVGTDPLPGEIHLREYGADPRDFAVSLSDVSAVHTVVGLQEP